QALILMPEIALTSAFLERFAARFGARPAAWHSAVGARRRERILAGVERGEVQVVAGARSALFLPFRDLGLIVVDEEHEQAYKQE
ncbi:DEAD/DEAH box helicase, partial [Acinetobacter baumannii]